MQTSTKKADMILRLTMSIVAGVCLPAALFAAEPIKPPASVQKTMEVVIEWGFTKGTETLAFDGQIEVTQSGKVEKVTAIAGDTATQMTGDATWRSPAGTSRRGIVAALTYWNAVRGPDRTIITVRTGSGSFSFMPVDLEGGPILAPEYGFFVANAASNITAKAFEKELAGKNLKTIRQQVRELPEQTWEGAMEAVHGKREWPPFPKVPYEPEMAVEVPDPYLTGLWRIGAWQIIKHCPRIKRSDVAKLPSLGLAHHLKELLDKCPVVDANDPEGVFVVANHPFLPLGCETDRILWALDHIGYHRVARDGISIFLDGQQKDGALFLDSDIERMHMIGALSVLWAMTDHYRLTGDKEWLKKEAPRMKAGADWILGRRKATMKEKLSQAELAGIKAGTLMTYGLQPAISSGENGTRNYDMNDAFGYRSVKLFADVIADIDPQMGADLSAEVEKYRKDILPVLNESIVLSPVMKVRDGTYRSFLPGSFQCRGPLSRVSPEGTALYNGCGVYHGDVVIAAAAIEAWITSGLLSADDDRIDGHFEVLEDVFLLDNIYVRIVTKDYNPDTQWFSHAGFVYQNGWTRLPEFYLAKDDIPNFLRLWLNHCAVDLRLNSWNFNEHITPGNNDKTHGNAVFLSNFRNLLVMELGEALWLARATPRAWLEQGKKIAVKNSPTYFGTVAYEIVSDVDNGKINATVELPSRKAPQSVVLRFRHPKSAPIQSVTVNGKDWNDFNRDKETIELRGLSGKVTVAASY